MDSGVFPVVGPLEAQACSRIAAGHGFSAAVAEDGRLFMWGRNDDHRLGTGGEEPVELTSVPLQVGGFGAAVTSVALGDAHACAITEAGALWCWGSGSRGQLGLGPSVQASAQPTRVESLPGAAQAAACGADFTLVCTTTGLFAFGANSDGQLGTGDATFDTWTPDRVVLGGPGGEAASPSSKPFARPVAGAAFALALCWCGLPATAPQPPRRSRSVPYMAYRDGRVFSWGSDADGCLGQGRGGSGAHVARPTPISGLSAAEVVCVDASCGEKHAAVVTEDGRLFVWGANDRGQLGLGSREGVDAPTHLTALSAAAVASVSCGAHHSVAVGRSGELFVWGAGDAGRLAYAADPEAEGGDRLLPVMLDNAVLTDERNQAAAVACGHDHTLVLTEGGTVFAWGPLDVDGDYGQIGAGHLEELEGGRECWYYLAEDGTVQGPFSHADMGGWMGQFFGDDLPVYYLPPGATAEDVEPLPPSLFRPLRTWFQDVDEAFLMPPDGPACQDTAAGTSSPPPVSEQGPGPEDAEGAPGHGIDHGENRPAGAADGGDGDGRVPRSGGEEGGEGAVGRPQALDVLRSLAGMPATPPAHQEAGENGPVPRGRAASPAMHFAPATRGDNEGGEGEEGARAAAATNGGAPSSPPFEGIGAPGETGTEGGVGSSAAAYEALDTSSLPEARAAVRALRHDLAAALAARDEALQTVASLQDSLRAARAGQSHGDDAHFDEKGQSAALQQHLARETAALERGMSALRREVVRAQVRNACQVFLHAGARHATACRHRAFRRLRLATSTGVQDEGGVSTADDPNADPRARALAAALAHSRNALARSQRQRAAQCLVTALRAPCARRARRGLRRWAAAAGLVQAPPRPEGQDEGPDAVRARALERLATHRTRAVLGGAMRCLFANAVRANATVAARNAHRRLQQRLQQRQRDLDVARMCAVRDKLVGVWRGRSRHSVRAAFLRWFAIAGVGKSEAGLRRQRMRLRTSQERVKKEQRTFEEAEGRLDRACHLVGAVAAFQRWRGNVQGQQRAALIDRLREERELLASELLRVYRHIGAVRQGDESWRESAGIRGHQLLRDARTLNSAIGTAQVAAERACSYAFAGLERAATLAAERQQAVARASARAVGDGGEAGVGEEEEEEEEMAPSPAAQSAEKPRHTSPLGRLKALREARAARGSRPPSPTLRGEKGDEAKKEDKTEEEGEGHRPVPVQAKESEVSAPFPPRSPPRSPSTGWGRLKARRASLAGLALKGKVSGSGLAAGRSTESSPASARASPAASGGDRGGALPSRDGAAGSPAPAMDAHTPQSASAVSHVSMSPLRALQARAETSTPPQAEEAPHTDSPPAGSSPGSGGQRKGRAARLGALRRASVAVLSMRRFANAGKAAQTTGSQEAAAPAGDGPSSDANGTQAAASSGGDDTGGSGAVFGVSKDTGGSGAVFGVGGGEDADDSGAVFGVGGGGDDGGSGAVFGVGGGEDADDSGAVFGVRGGSDEDGPGAVFGVQ